MNHDSLMFASPLGTLEIAAYQGKVTHLTPIHGEVPAHQAKTMQFDFLTKAAAEVVAFLEGRLQQFTVPVQTQGSAIQQKVWAELQRIPYGQYISYREMAERIGNPNAVRAVGSACGANPIPLIIPCHRVLRSDGTLGGFGWGLEVKAFLLDIEAGALAMAA